MLDNIVFGTLVGLYVAYFFPVAMICGNSMYPTLKDGEFYLTRRVVFKSKCKKGKIYVVRSNGKTEHKYFIKRLADKTLRDCYFLGDNADESYDSRAFGYIPSKDVQYQLLFKIGGAK